MRELSVDQISAAVSQLCIQANRQLPADVRAGLWAALEAEDSLTVRDVLEQLLENCAVAERDGMALCQDTGMAVVFCELGQEVHITGGALEEAIQAGVRRGYREGYLRPSVVADPLQRVNTGDNTPAIIHYAVIPGDSLALTVAPKGFGSENGSALKMLTPGDGWEGVQQFVIETVARVGASACPPLVVGVGLGGTSEKAVWLAKKALLRELTAANPDPQYAAREAELLQALNALGIGPAGWGGHTTALAVHIEPFPTHIAGLPVAVNLSCHALRHASVTL
ncbi:MAG: fumarate hydratase [Anaerolineaceae bacterium]|nr:fumarate hydratase [Anaerolineaceae bacterium]